MNRRHIAAALLAAALPFTLTGCYNGYNALTSTQEEGGDLANADVGDVRARAMVWVADPKNPQQMAFSGSFLGAAGAQPDELVSVAPEPAQGQVTPTGGPFTIQPNQATMIGFGAPGKSIVWSGATVPPSSVVNTTLTFKNAGTTQVPVLVVPGTGPYASVVRGAAAAAAPAAPAEAPPAPDAAQPAEPQPEQPAAQ